MISQKPWKNSYVIKTKVLNPNGSKLLSYSAANGGGTWAGGTLTGNFATCDGGGIFLGGTLTLGASTLSGNSAAFEGGAIFVNCSGTAAFGRTVRIYWSAQMLPLGPSE